MQNIDERIERIKCMTEEEGGRTTKKPISYEIGLLRHEGLEPSTP